MQMVKKLFIPLVIVATLLMSNYMTYKYTKKYSNKQSNKFVSKMAVTALLNLDQNRTQLTKFMFAVDTYANIVNASLQQNHLPKEWRVDDLQYYYFLCEHWNDNLSSIVLESLNQEDNSSNRPYQYELFLKGSANLDQLCE